MGNSVVNVTGGPVGFDFSSQAIKVKDIILISISEVSNFFHYFSPWIYFSSSWFNNTFSKL